MTIKVLRDVMVTMVTADSKVGWVGVGWGGRGRHPLLLEDLSDQSDLYTRSSADQCSDWQRLKCKTGHEWHKVQWGGAEGRKSFDVYFSMQRP